MERRQVGRRLGAGRGRHDHRRRQLRAAAQQECARHAAPAARALIQPRLGHAGKGAGQCLLGGDDRLLALESGGDGPKVDRRDGHRQRHDAQADARGVDQQVGAHLSRVIRAPGLPFDLAVKIAEIRSDSDDQAKEKDGPI